MDINDELKKELKSLAREEAISAVHSTPTKSIILSDSFIKSRRSYIFFSFLLLAWEFIGLRINNLTNESTSLDLQNPEAVPFFLLFAVFYFSYKFCFEWILISHDLKDIDLLKRDFAYVHLFSLISVAVYLYQAFSGDQIFTFILGNNTEFVSIVIGIFHSYTLYVIVLYILAAYLLPDLPEEKINNKTKISTHLFKDFIDEMFGEMAEEYRRKAMVSLIVSSLPAIWLTSKTFHGSFELLIYYALGIGVFLVIWRISLIFKKFSNYLMEQKDR